MRQEKEIATAGTDLERIDRLGEKIHRARFQGSVAYRSIVGRRNHHHRNVLKLPALAQLLGELHTGHSGIR